MPALVDPGHLRLAISTSNASPGLARRLREDLEHLFDEEFVRYLSQLGRVRAHLKKVAAGDDGRFEILHSLVADFRLNGSIHYPAGWRQRVADLLSRRKPSESETGSAR
jgi:siroheme synthase (precorrin-2 oxidase/ferrochelatase)